MAGGNWDPLVGKIRPGTYVNVQTTKVGKVGNSKRGTVILPIFNHNYGPDKEFVRIYNSSPDAAVSALGYSIYDNNPNALLVREALKKAYSVVMYFFGGGTAATKDATLGGGVTLTATAKYGGERGNALSFNIVENPDGVDLFDVTVYLDSEPVGKILAISTIAQLIAAGGDYVTFSGDGALAAVAGVNLEGGTNGVQSNLDVTTFLDKAEGEVWNTMCFPIDGADAEALKVALKTKINYIRAFTGKGVNAVVPEFNADYEGIISVTKGVVLNTGEKLSPAQACAYIAGATAAATCVESLTYREYDGAVSVVEPYTHEEAEVAIKNGEFFFSMSEEGKVIVEYDINSLTTFDEKKSEDYRKNRIMRVYDQICESIRLNFPPNRFVNGPRGWDSMEGLGKGILETFEEMGAIMQPDYDNDFKVDRTKSKGDQTFFDVGLQAIDSSEKLFFTVHTR